jgi:small subunit ribosomal protein S20
VEAVAKTKSAEKRARQAQKRTLRNKSLKSALRTAIRKFNETLAKGTREEAAATLKKALIAIDKAVTKGILHKNTAARKKSRLARQFNRQAG